MLMRSWGRTVSLHNIWRGERERERDSGEEDLFTREETAEAGEGREEGILISILSYQLLCT